MDNRLNLSSMLNRPKAILPAPRVVPNNSTDFEQVVENETRAADKMIAESDAIINGTPAGAPVVRNATEENISDSNIKLDRLMDDDFPFDDSQLHAVYGLVQQQYGCLIGAAGTGKTTVTKKFVDLLRDGLDEIDVSQYWKRGVSDEHDDYEIPERLIPSILMCSFTGRSTQMTKKNFPREWHPNIMTIHRALGFYPEFYPDFDEATGQMVNKRRFVPAYTAENQMPWDIIIVDECGMLGLDLWHQLWAAIKQGARVYFIGDINQLPPTHGKSILGFAMNKWPVFELTHVHRQQGANNSIVDNAHRILKGLQPVSDCKEQLGLRKPEEIQKTLNYMVKNKDWRFLTVSIDDEHPKAAQRIKMMLKLLNGHFYEPNRDVLITPVNGFEQTQSGYTLGQAPLNQGLVTMLNDNADRYIIDGGREKKNFAVGDKVMATVNDHEAGITNGMTGIITSIAENGAYIGETRRFGLISEVNAFYDGLEEDEDDSEDFNLEEMVADSEAGLDELKKREKGERGPASHIVTVEFGEGEHAFSLPFDSKSEVASLQLAYAATCHKMQGGECPIVFVIIHQTHKRPLCREWAYTALTRASQRCVFLMTRQGMGFALGKQNIKGTTLKQKIASFAALTEVGLLGPTVRVKLPQACSLVTDLTPYQPKEVIPNAQDTQLAEATRTAEYAGREETTPEPEPRIVFRDRVIIVEVKETQDVPGRVGEPPIDGGVLRSTRADGVRVSGSPELPAAGSGGGEDHGGYRVATIEGPRPQLPPPARLVSTHGAVRMALELSHATVFANRLLTYQPAPVAPAPKPAKVNPLQAMLQRKGQTQQQMVEENLKLIDGPLETKPVNRLGLILSNQVKKK